MKEEDRQSVWVLYGWFSGLMCVGSVFGAVTWAAWMQYLVSNSIVTLSPGLSMLAQTTFYVQYTRWGAVFYVAYPIEFLCLSVAKLLVLHRIADFAAPKGGGLSRRLAVGGRAVMAAVVVGNVVGLCANVAAAVYWAAAADSFSAAADAFASNNNTANSLFLRGNQKVQLGSDADSAQNFCEAVVLLIIILAFAVVGLAGDRRLSSALVQVKNEHVEALGKQLRRQIVGTTAFVFVTFLLRAVFSIMNAVSNALQNDAAACADVSGACDPTCFNVWQLMQNWITFTPEFQLMVVLISSPLAMIVALWGMTSDRMLQAMKSNNVSERKMQQLS